MKCQKCLHKFSKPIMFKGLGKDTWPLCPHCRTLLYEGNKENVTKKDYKRINR